MSENCGEMLPPASLPLSPPPAPNRGRNIFKSFLSTEALALHFTARALCLSVQNVTPYIF